MRNELSKALIGDPPAKFAFKIHNPNVIVSYSTQGWSRQIEFPSMQPWFREAMNPMCPTRDDIEDTEHSCLLFQIFFAQRRDRLAGIAESFWPFAQIIGFWNDALI